MIKINLAKQKNRNFTQIAPISGARGGLSSLNVDFSNLKIDTSKILEVLKDPVIRKVLFLLIVIGGAYFGLDYYKTSTLKKLGIKIAQLTVERDRLQAEREKTRGYDQIKASLEADEKMIRTKIETVEKLIADRQLPPKLLIALASGVPSDIWLTEVRLNGDQFNFYGNSLGFSPISDFMKSMGESAYFDEVSLVQSALGKDDQNIETAQFEVSAKKRQGL